MPTLFLYSVVFTCLLVTTALYFTRHRWLNHIPQTLYTRIQSFTNDIEEGLTSDDFDLTPNVASGDSRAGLDVAGKREIQKIMRSKRVGFDEARRIYTQSTFAKNNIGPDGRPRDPKFVSFS